MYGSGLYMKFEEVKPVYKEYGLFFKFFFFNFSKTNCESTPRLLESNPEPSSIVNYGQGCSRKIIMNSDK